MLSVLDQVVKNIKNIVINNAKYAKHQEELFEILKYISTQNNFNIFLHHEKKVFSYGRKIKMSTFLNKHIELPDKLVSHINLLCEIYGNAFDQLMNPEFTIYSGEDIVKVYATIFESCMTKNPGLVIFQNNPEVVRVLVCNIAGSSARALIWKTNSGRFVLDRIYPNDSVAIPKMTEYALKQGWCVRKGHGAVDNSNSTSGAEVLMPGRPKPICLDEVVTLEIPEGLSFYSDTFVHGRFRGKCKWDLYSDIANEESETTYYFPFLSATGKRRKDWMYNSCRRCESEMVDIRDATKELCQKCEEGLSLYGYPFDGLVGYCNIESEIVPLKELTIYSVQKENEKFTICTKQKYTLEDVFQYCVKKEGFVPKDIKMVINKHENR